MTANNLAPLAARIRDLRAERAWSQEHLAGAAGLSLRTVQRVEGGYASASETLLALAAALEVPASELTELIPPPPSTGDRIIGLTARQTAWLGSILALPAILFVTANLANEAWEAGWAINYLDGAEPVGLESPIVILGGLAAAMLLNLVHVIRFDIRRQKSGVIAERLQLRLTTGPVLVLLAGAACAGILGTYLIAENIGHLVADIAGA